MHCVFSYDLSVDAGPRRQEIVGQIESILRAHNNVRRLTTFYILNVNDAQDWDNLRRQLTDFSQSITEPLFFILTPPQNGGHYDGLLRSGEWNEINIIAGN